MEIAENYIVASRKKKHIVIHSVLPFKNFVTLLDILFDANYKDITEISADEFHNLYMNTDCSAYHIDRETFKVVVEGLSKK